LKSIVDGYGLPLGDTDTGKAWCLKALHPADPFVEVKGIPDESSVPSVFVNYQTIQLLSPPAGSVDGWNGILSMMPHPINFGTWRTSDLASAHTATGVHLNAQLTGVTHGNKFSALIAQAARWRLAYMSCTIVQDGADLSNQGTIVAAQSIVSPLKVNCDVQVVDGVTHTTNLVVAQPHVLCFDPQMIPVYANLQSMPNAYFARSKEGLYMPLKLTRTHQNWRSTADAIQYTMGSAGTGPNWLTGGSVTLTNGTDTWPFPGFATATPFAGVGTVPGVTSDLCNDIWGSIAWNNLALTTSLRVFYRVGYELQVMPGTELTPFQSVSPKYDPRALLDYYAISRELKDAYPENFNSLGKIWDEISGVLKMAAPVVSMIPGYGSLVGGVMTGAQAIGDTIRRATKSNGENPSAAAVEKGQQAVKLISAAAANKDVRAARRVIAKAQGRKSKPKSKPKGRGKSKPKGKGRGRGKPNLPPGNRYGEEW